MDKGIRPEAISKFMAMLPTRVNTREGNTAFRKGVIAHLEEQFGITHASGATHYNHAFVEAKKKAATDETIATLLVGLGRPEDKKGGRKPKPKAAPPAAVNPLLQNFVAAGAVQVAATPAAMITDAASQVGLEQLTGAVQEQQAEEAAPESPQLYSVRKVSDGTMVAEGLPKEQAEELIAKAAAAKKAKLELVA